MIHRFDIDLVIASNNKGKLKEFGTILNPYFKRLILPSDLGLEFEVEETGNTFFENSMLKAAYLHERLPEYAVLSDDSGLIVDALDGEPGVYSARYAGKNATSEQNIDKLLERMKGIKDRAARFYCAITLILPKPKSTIIQCAGACEGRILESRDGAGGFGYDSVFFSTDLNKSFGIATSEEKNSVSHRMRSMNNIITECKKHL